MATLFYVLAAFGLAGGAAVLLLGFGFDEPLCVWIGGGAIGSGITTLWMAAVLQAVQGKRERRVSPGLPRYGRPSAKVQRWFRR